MPSAPRKRCTGSPSCSALLPPGVRYCPAHAQQYEERRGTRQARGYDAAHDALRRDWQRKIDAGETVWCARCHRRRIRPGDAWDLGHTDDRRSYTGPECERCNRSAGGRRGARRGR